MKRYKGFTLVEILVTVALVTIITATLFPLGVSQLRSANVKGSTDKLISNITLMQEYSYANRSDEEYGLKFETDGYYLYQGTSYSTATDTEYEEYRFGTKLQGVSLNSGDELSFSKSSIIPEQTGTITLTREGETYQITILNNGNIRSARL